MKNFTKMVWAAAALIAFSFCSNAQVLNQNAAWPNVAWTLTGTYDAGAVIGDPSIDANFSYNDDAAGSGSTDILFATSPVIDLTAAFGAGETELYLDYDYNYNFGSFFDLEWYDADAASWMTWESIADNSGTTSNWCGNLQGVVTSTMLDISGLTGTQLAGFQYRFHNDASAVWGWGFCMAAPTIYSVAPPACPDPSAGTATNLTATTADIGWTENGSATTWNIEWGVSGFTPTGTPTIAGTTNNPESLTGLTATTDYQFYVQADCGGSGTSGWAGPFSFTTPCAVITPAYLTDFGTFLPNCWDEADNGDEITGPTGLGAGAWGQNGTLARINLFTTGKSDWLLSPEFDLSAGGWELVLEASAFDFGASPGSFSGMGSDDSLQVLISTDGGTSWTPILTFDVLNPPASTATDYIIDLSAYTGTSNLFGILATEGAANDPEDYWANVHSFEIRQPLTCAEPTALAVSAITENSADVTWTAGNGSQLGWEVSVVPSGNMPMPGTSGTSPYNATGLTNNTAYHAYVREICSVGDTTAWVGPVPFTTACGTVLGDTTTTAIVASGLTYSDAGSTAACYTNTSDSPGSNGAADVWYQYTLDNCAGSVVASLCGSSYDTYLTIYAADGSTVLASNDDDFTNCGSSRSYIDLDILGTAGVNPGDVIYIVVDGFGSNNGSYVLDVTTTLAPAPTATVNGSEVMADQAGATYQWLDCDNGNAVIPGATDQSFIAPLSGNFAVEVTNFGCVDTSACEAVAVSLPADLVISEINYNGAESGTDTTEFIEIYNNGATDVNLLGYSFVEGVTHTVTENFVLASGAYAVFAFDSAAIANVYGFTGAQQWTAGGLSNAGEDITLYDPAGNLVDTVNYDDVAPWPTAADGNGPSLVICDFTQDNNDGSNWFASTTDVGVQVNGLDVFGSPGSANVCVIQCPSAFAVTACDSYTVPSGNETYTMSGVYMDTITGTAGCDSIMTITLTINTSTTGTDVITACDSLQWIDGMTYYASTNTPTFTIVGGNANGCDSTVTLDLTIVNATTGTDVITECDSLTWIDGITYYASTNTPTFTIVGGNSVGCDSTVTLDLTIIPNEAPVPDAATLPDVTDECSATPAAPTATDACSGVITGTPNVTFPITAQGTTVVTWTFDDGAGLTSTQTQNVIIDDVTPPTASNPFTLQVQCISDVPTANPSVVTDEADNCGTPTVAFVSEVSDGQSCPETLTRTYSVTDAGGNSITVTQTIIVNDVVNPVADMATLPTETGFCDVTPATPTATDNCSGTINGVPDVTFPINTVGTTTVTWTFTDDCGNSITQTQDVVIEEIDVNTSFAGDGITILASNNDPGVTYQWYNCTEDTLMTGETNFNFTPTFSADFAVIITQDGCVDTSACVTITEVGIENILLSSVAVYPNPVSDFLNVDLAGLENAHVRLLDMSGKVLREEKCETTQLFTMEMNEAPGAYIIEVQSNEFVKQFKLIKE